MVDFLELASTSRWLIDRALRDQDDDIVQLQVPSSGAPPENDSILYQMQEQEDVAYYGDAGTRPFLSKSAEAELYLLATNFLLCKQLLSCRVQKQSKDWN